MEFHKELWEKLKNYREEGKVAYRYYRTIVAKQRNNQGLTTLRGKNLCFTEISTTIR